MHTCNRTETVSLRDSSTPSMATLANEFLQRLTDHPSLRDTITFEFLQRFIHLTHKLCPEIISLHVNPVPDTIQLPLHVERFLSSVTAVDISVVKLCWIAFGDLILKDRDTLIISSDGDIFREHGHEYHIGAEHLRPPSRTCSKVQCQGHHLVDERKTEGQLFTLRRGVLPVWAVSSYCKNCSTRYYHNYSVTLSSAPGATRNYYCTISPFIQVTGHSYVEADLCKFIETQMVFTHASAQSISRVYNMALKTPEDSQENASTFLKKSMDGELVLDAFFLHALLRDNMKRGACLSVPHHGGHNDRFTDALNERNLRMAGTGEDGHIYRMTAGVTDGITVGHPCCCVHDCKVPLEHHHHRFCPTHRHLNGLCRVKGCALPAELGHRTCSLVVHRATEQNPRPSLGQLRNRLDMLNVHQVGRAGSVSTESLSTSAASFNTAAASSSPPPTLGETGILSLGTPHQAKAQFGIAGVKDFLKATFPSHYPGGMPSYIFYDNNCQLMVHLIHSGDDYFIKVGLPVDMFHFKCKHKETDVMCQPHCNPACFKELVGNANTSNGWIFNSLAAEQANVWFGKFAANIWEMLPTCYNFYLDEVIAVRNWFIVSELRRKGRVPHLVPEEILHGEV
ncbi:hypothetical protein K439DRAFT_1620562 [Ramaria rubella]|nr:hypothetical protein K439DRAFT_1620562 [Ramaria rubella]